MPQLADYLPLIERLGFKLVVCEDKDAWTYAKDISMRVLIKLQKDASEERKNFIEAKALRCKAIAASTRDFIPEIIIDIVCLKNQPQPADDLLYYTVQTAPGLTLAEYLDALLSELGEIDSGIECYWNTIDLLANASIPAQIMRVAAWGDYIRNKMHSALLTNAELLAAKDLALSETQLMQIDAAINTRLQIVPKVSLVHGNLNPENCLVDPEDTSKPCAIVNWSTDTVIGDPRLDVASILFFAENFPKGFCNKATRILRGLIYEKYGRDENQVFNLYRIYFATVLLDNPQYSNWAIENLRNLNEILRSTDIWQPPRAPMLNQYKIRMRRYDATIADTTDAEPQSPRSPLSTHSTTSSDEHSMIGVSPKGRRRSYASTLDTIPEARNEVADPLQPPTPGSPFTPDGHYPYSADGTTSSGSTLANLWAPLRRSSLVKLGL